MKTAAIVKEATGELATVASGTAGLAAAVALGVVGNKLTAKIPAFGPPWLQTLLQKVTPGLAVMLLAYLANNAAALSKIPYLDRKAFAMGGAIGGFGMILKAYAPDLYNQFLQLKGLGATPAMPETIDLVQKSSNSYGMLNGFGEPAQNTYQLLN